MGKILILSNHSYMLYRFRLELLLRLAVHHDVILSMPFVGHENDFQAKGFRCIQTPVDRRGSNLFSDAKLFSGYRQLLRQEKPDLVISYSIKPNIYGGIACRMAGIPFCANVQGLGSAFHKNHLCQLVTWLYRIALTKAQVVFFENRSNATLFVRKRILAAEKVKVLNGAGINLDTFRCHPYPNNSRIHFLFLGRFMREKGIYELLHSVQRLQREGYTFVLDLVGFFEESCPVQLQELIASDIVRFHGFQTDPIPFYARADCVVLPSYHEGMSNVLLEAAALGRPVITSDIPGCREAVLEDVSGFLCTARDPDSLYEALKRMLMLSRQQRMEMGLAGRAHMERHFDRKQIIARTEQALPLPSKDPHGNCASAYDMPDFENM